MYKQESQWSFINEKDIYIYFRLRNHHEISYLKYLCFLKKQVEILYIYLVLFKLPHL